MVPLYVALGVQWAIWFGGVVSTSVWVADCKNWVASYDYYYLTRDATGLCLNYTR